MKSLVREARLKLGLSMEQLGARMGISPTSVSSLERNEAAGTAKTGTIQRALEAMGMASVSVVVTRESMTQIERTALRISRSVESTMALEGQGVSPSVAAELYDRALRNELAKL